MTHNPSTNTLLEMKIRREALAKELVHAMIYRNPVRTGEKFGYVDEIYVSVHRLGVVRARVTTQDGRVHHADIETIEVL